MQQKPRLRSDRGTDVGCLRAVGPLGHQQPRCSRVRTSDAKLRLRKATCIIIAGRTTASGGVSAFVSMRLSSKSWVSRQAPLVEGLDTSPLQSIHACTKSPYTSIQVRWFLTSYSKTECSRCFDTTQVKQSEYCFSCLDSFLQQAGESQPLG